MISFIPEENTPVNLACIERLNSEYLNKICPDHPDGLSVIQVGVHKNELVFKVHASCCDKFYEDLQGLEPYPID